MDFRIYLFFTLLLATVNTEYVDYTGYKVYKVVPKTEKDVENFRELEEKGEYSFWNDIIKEDQDVKIMVAPEKEESFKAYLKQAGVEGNLVIENVQKLIDAQFQRPRANRLNTNYGWEYYQTLDEIYEWMEKMAEDHSDVAEIVTIGNTHEGRLIKGIVIDYKKHDNPTAGIIEGGIHAREWISPATVTWIINEFLTSNDREIRDLAENIVWHIFPVVNPDGYEYTFTDNRMWRKNRNPLGSMSCAQWNLNDDMSNGIDLNRNFGFLWMTVGASSIACAETYAGPYANSEFETRAIINYVLGIQGYSHLVYYFAFHSFSQMVLVPYSHVAGVDVFEAPNYADMFEIAVKGMDKLKERNGTEYVVGTSKEILYDVSGSSFDWVRGEADVPIVYLFELRDTGDYGFLLPPELIVDNNKEIMDGLIEMDRVTRQMGYYHRSAGVVYNLHMILLLLSLIIIN